ncbi:LysR family transcriptional regulator [Brucella cytisi]|uniref:LysR family transcriptional regulator n=1 Tax=Brucella cytisi TaxID=407152 RepID=UPI0035E2761E
MLRHDCNPEIQLRQLHYVIAAAEHGSFRQAALAVGVQESAISRRIRDLEDQAGAALFIRCPRGVSLTEAGKKFLTHARRGINEIDLALKEVDAAGRAEKGVLRIGIFTSLASGFIAELLQRYREQNPGIRSTFVEGAPADHVVAVRRHEIDVAFLTLSQSRILGASDRRVSFCRIMRCLSETTTPASLRCSKPSTWCLAPTD